jgi:hypothetical protein
MNVFPWFGYRIIDESASEGENMLTETVVDNHFVARCASHRTSSVRRFEEITFGK